MTKIRHAGTFSAQLKCAPPLAREAPRTRHQAPEKLQTPSSKGCIKPARSFGTWSLELLWSLVLGAWIFLFLPAQAQLVASKVAKITIQRVGPASVSDELVRANIRVKPGDQYFPAAVDDDVRNLYGTGLFYNVQVASTNSPEGIVLTYVVQGNPRLTEIRYQGNKKFSEAKLHKSTTSKVGEPFNERKLFTDSQEIQKLYQKKGYPRTEVKYTFSIDENTGRAVATFEIKESPKVKIKDVEFIGAKAF